MAPPNLPVAVDARALAAGAGCWGSLPHPTSMLELLERFGQGGSVDGLRVPVVRMGVQGSLIALVRLGGGRLGLWRRDECGRGHVLCDMRR